MTVEMILVGANPGSRLVEVVLVGHFALANEKTFDQEVPTFLGDSTEGWAVSNPDHPKRTACVL